MGRSTAVESDRAARARIRQLDMRRFAEEWRGRAAELMHSSRYQPQAIQLALGAPEGAVS